MAVPETRKIDNSVYTYITVINTISVEENISMMINFLGEKQYTLKLFYR